MYTVERSSQTEIFPLYFVSQKMAHESGAWGNELVSYSSGFGPHINGAPNVCPLFLTSGRSRNFGESCPYAGIFSTLSGSASPVRAIVVATSLDGEITS